MSKDQKQVDSDLKSITELPILPPYEEDVPSSSTLAGSRTLMSELTNSETFIDFDETSVTDSIYPNLYVDDIDSTENQNESSHKNIFNHNNRFNTDTDVDKKEDDVNGLYDIDSPTFLSDGMEDKLHNLIGNVNNFEENHETSLKDKKGSKNESSPTKQVASKSKKFVTCIICYQIVEVSNTSYCSSYCKYHPDSKKGDSYRCCRPCLQSYILNILKQPANSIPCLYGCGCHPSLYKDLPRIFSDDLESLQKCYDIIVKRNLRNMDSFVECANPSCEYGEIISTCSKVTFVHPDGKKEIDQMKQLISDTLRIRPNLDTRYDMFTERNDNYCKVLECRETSNNFVSNVISPMVNVPGRDSVAIDINQEKNYGTISPGLLSQYNSVENLYTVTTAYGTSSLANLHSESPFYAPNVIWHCRHCGHNTCLKHRIPSHNGETCEEFDSRVSVNEMKSLKWIENNTRKCPKCGMIIEKHGGCSEMVCRCENKFYWNDISSIPYLIGIPTLLFLFCCIGISSCCFCCCCCCKLSGDLDPRSNEDFRRWV